jgi:hypothetical protein
VPVAERDEAVGGDHDLRHRAAHERLGAEPVEPDQLAARQGQWRLGEEHTVGRGRAGHLLEYASFEVHRPEQAGVAEQHLGLAEEQHPLVGQCEVEPGQDARLGLGIEVHERVATREQVDAGNRGVLHQVVAAEDDRTAQIFAEGEPAAGQLEIPVNECRWNVAQVALGITGVPCLVEALFVDVGRVDLHLAAERLGTQDVREQDGQRVGLFAGCAPGAPHAHRRVGVSIGQDRRQHVGAQMVPRVRVPEEVGHIDQDRVEEGGELLRVNLEVVEIFAVVAHADLRHSATHAAHQARPFVAGEVEAARLLQIEQQRLELRIELVHRVPPDGCALPGYRTASRGARSVAHTTLPPCAGAYPHAVVSASITRSPRPSSRSESLGAPRLGAAAQPSRTATCR